MVLSLYARGLTTGEISAHFADIYGAAVSKDTISRITDKGDRGDGRLAPARWSGSTQRCSSTPRTKIRDGQVGPRPVYARDRGRFGRHRDVLGMWAGEGDGSRPGTGWRY